MKAFRTLIILAAISILTIAGCDKDNDTITGSNTKTIVGTGSVVSQTVNVSAFNSVMNLASFDVTITKGTPQQVVLKAQQNILDVTTYQVNNGELLLGIQENTSIQTPYGLKAEITIPEITRIGIIGAGNFDLSGGHEDVLYIDITGAGNVMAYNLDVDTCYINATGVGNCHVKVNNLLNIMISGVGNVYYKGSPALISNITGVGNVYDDN